MEKLFERQLQFQELIGTPTEFITAYDRVKACNIQLRRANDEINEALRELPYDLSGYGKSKKILSFHNQKCLDEIVDAQLFLINALNILGISSEDFFKSCYGKQELNMIRFKNKKRFVEKADDFLIIIEGVDGVGKTSICESLSRKTGIPILRMPDTNGDIEHMSQFYRRTVAEIQHPLILDRFYPSSIVYSQFFDRTPLLDDLTKIHEKKDVYIFIVDTDKPYRGDSFINEEQWPHIRKIYLDQAKINKWKIIQNNTTLENCVQEILAELQF